MNDHAILLLHFHFKKLLMKLIIKLKLYSEGGTTKKMSRNKNGFSLLAKSEKKRIIIDYFLLQWMDTT